MNLRNLNVKGLYELTQEELFSLLEGKRLVLGLNQVSFRPREAHHSLEDKDNPMWSHHDVEGTFHVYLDQQRGLLLADMHLTHISPTDGLTKEVKSYGTSRFAPPNPSRGLEVMDILGPVGRNLRQNDTLTFYSELRNRSDGGPLGPISSHCYTDGRRIEG